MSFIVVKRPKKNRERAATIILRAKKQLARDNLFAKFNSLFSSQAVSKQRDYDIYFILIL